ncbi:MAG: hypothetical protein ABS77_01455 [Phenylobacterium sp. SCN 69-14]|nr:MAG: hypothetical protein ABS77_01455 [Phenylobacterium sp. SCN 69-14]
MPSTNDPPEYKYIAYIDESGDPGIKKVKPLDENGSSEWLVVAAVVMAAEREADVPQWISEMMTEMASRQMREIHFAKLNPARKLIACRHVAARPVRCFVVMSNKQNMRGFRNPWAEKIPSDNWFYCWMTRLLLERVTHWVERRSMREMGSPARVKLVYSERGGLSYTQMNAYYQWLRMKGDNQYLPLGNLAYDTLDMRLLEVRNHAGHAGLKLPDIVASAFFKAADIHDTGACDPQFARALRPRMARSPQETGSLISGYGLKLMPKFSTLTGKVEECQRDIFRDFGYPQQWWQKQI